jgi:hypothetical protein
MSRSRNLLSGDVFVRNRDCVTELRWLRLVRNSGQENMAFHIQELRDRMRSAIVLDKMSLRKA